jgi:hypothetical protein
MQGDSIRVNLFVTEVFERLGIPYAVGRSLSSSVHGVMRSTLDVDIIADMRMEHIQMIAGAIAHRSSYNLIHYTTAFKVDVFIPKQGDIDRMQLQRPAPFVITVDPERSVYVTSPEDVILSFSARPKRLASKTCSNAP